MAGILIICGLILMALGMQCVLWLCHDVVGAVAMIFALFCIIDGIYMAIDNEPEKCACAETVQVETCQDCGGVIE